MAVNDFRRLTSSQSRLRTVWGRGARVRAVSESATILLPGSVVSTCLLPQNGTVTTGAGHCLSTLVIYTGSSTRGSS